MKKALTILFFFLTLCLGLSAQNATQGKLVKSYPIPASTVIYFEFSKSYDRTYSLQVFNFMGRMVHEEKVLAVKTTLNLSNFFRGMYYYQLLDRNKRVVETGRFQVVK